MIIEKLFIKYDWLMETTEVFINHNSSQINQIKKVLNACYLVLSCYVPYNPLSITTSLQILEESARTP